MPYSAYTMGKSILKSDDKDHYADLLLRVAGNQDRLAFSALFDHFAPRVKAFMMRKGSTSEQAEDLVQETMLTVWTKARLYSAERGSVSTWVFTIARNLRIDRLRRDKAQLYQGLDDFDAADDSEGADEAMGRSQEDNHVTKALDQIPSEQRELLILSYVEDVTQSEIAQRFNIPLGTVKSRMRLGYQRLRKILEQVK